MNNNSIFSPFQKLILTSILLGILAYFGYLVRSLLIPFVLSFLLSYLLNPIVDRFEWLCKSRAIGILLLYISFFVSLIFGCVFILPILANEITGISRVFPQYLDSSQQFLLYWQQRLELDYPFLSQYEWLENIQSQFQNLVIVITKSIPDLVLSFFSIITYLSLVPIILYFFLQEGRELKMRMMQLIPNKYFEMTVYLIYNIGNKIGGYLRGIMVEAVIISLLTAASLFGLGTDYALLLGVISGIANIIPYVGPFIGIIPAIIVFYVQIKTMNAILLIALIFLIVQIIDNIILKPIIYSQSVDLHPLSVLLSILLGGMLAGVWGLVLAVPFAGAIKVISSQVMKEMQYRSRMYFERSVL